MATISTGRNGPMHQADHTSHVIAGEAGRVNADVGGFHGGPLNEGRLPIIVAVVRSSR